MEREQSHTGSIVVIHSQVPRDPRLIKWVAALLCAIVLLFTFLVARAYIIPAAKLAAIGQDHPLSVQVALAPTSVPATVQELVSALDDTAPSARANAAQALAAMHAVGATDALLAATYDINAVVREEAAAALGEIGAFQALPRLQELQIVSGNILIMIAAFEAEAKITKNIGAALNVPRSRVQVWAVAQNGVAYAAAENELFALYDGVWEHVSYLPGSPNSLSANSDGQTLVMSTKPSGLYRSQDGGKTWEQLQFSIQTTNRVMVTAVVLDRANTNQVYIALSAKDSMDQLNSLGIASSTDGGKTWSTLPDSPTWSVTNRLVLDRTTPGYLYGLSNVGPWRYQLLSGTPSVSHN